MLKSLFEPTLRNVGGWALALGVVGLWQYYSEKRSSGQWTEDAKEWNKKVLDSQAEKK